ncbi:MAG: hypothetical protein NC483_00985 [Ruminococcus sp.]|nr:hypothetical protein [Ruminococcus sp.]
MAKKQKFKNVKLEQQELQPTTIGAFENRKKSSLGTFLILAIFILVIVFLPEISEYVDAYFNPVINVPGTNGNNPVNSNPTPDPGEDVKDYNNEFYALTSDLVVKRDDISLSNISIDLESNTMNFQVANVTQGSLVLGDLNYYLELYNADKTLLERVKITGTESVAPNYPREYKKKILTTTAVNFDTFLLVTKDAQDYPNFSINSDEDGKGSLVCRTDNETITYKFTSGALKELTSEYRHSINDVNYATEYTENKNKATNYNSKSGVVSSFIEYNEGYTITSNINLSEASRQYIFNADTFKLDTEPKIVKFEMEAQGFTCN